MKASRPWAGDLVEHGGEVWEVIDAPPRRRSVTARRLVGTPRERAATQLLYLRHMTAWWRRRRPQA